MRRDSAPSAPALVKGRRRPATMAFEVVSLADLPGLRISARRLRHRLTGAEVLAVETDDPTLVLALAFPTPPADDTGVAHVLEHLLFRGSRGFPGSQPFAALLAGSLQCHLNASTGPDRTTVQVASRHAADLANIAEVTLDAVLRPLLRDSAFDEEAWHVAAGTDGGPRLGGIVLTEMRGHLAAPVHRLDLETRRALLPGSVYARAHGGDPAAIPALTPAAVRRFHRRHYHPSGARVLLWGGPLSARLDQLDRHLAGFGRRAAVPALPPAEPVAAPRRVRLTGAGETRGALVALAWALPEEVPGLGPLAWPLLAGLLAEGEGAVLHGALDAAGLGVAGPGEALVRDTRPAMLRLVRQNVDPARLDAVEEVALAALADAGDLRDRADAALRGLALRLAEEGSGTRPRGLVVFDRILESWRHGADPLALLDPGPALDRLRAGLAEGALAEAIRVGLLDNPHRVAVALEPGPAPALAPVAPAHRWRRAKDASPSGAAPMPSLSRADLPRRLEATPAETDGPVLRLDLGERGVVRADVAIDLTGLPAARLALVPLLARAWLGAARPANGLAALSTALWTRAGPAGAAAGLVLRGRALAADRTALLEAMAAALHAPVPPPESLGRALADAASEAEARRLAVPHALVELRLRSGLDLAGGRAEALEGLSQGVTLRALRGRDDAEELASRLAALRRDLLAPGRLTLGLSGPGDPGPGHDLLAAVAEAADVVPVPFEGPAPGREGIAVAAGVQAVGRAVDLRAAGLRPGGATAVGVVALGTGWLWEEVRVRGGAYGVRATLDPATGVLACLSARDPHVLRTLDTIAGAGAWLRREASGPLLERCVVGAVGQAVRVPGAAALALDVLQRRRVGITDAQRQAALEETLATSPSDLRALADALDAGLPGGPVAILGGAEALRAALAERPGAFTLVEG